jgi:Tol biopolymer transport system component
MTFKGAHDPVWLPDGKTIVFGTVRGGESVFMSIGEGDEPGSEQLFEVLPPRAENPVWSPDGSLVAYGVVSKDGVSRDLNFARTSGGGSTGLTSNFLVPRVDLDAGRKHYRVCGRQVHRNEPMDGRPGNKGRKALL